MTKPDAERIAIDLGVDIEAVRALVEAGLTGDQIRIVLTHPLSVIEWRTETTTSGDFAPDEDGSRLRAASSGEWVGGGLIPHVDGQATVETVHIGSTFNIESARLYMKTTFRWERLSIIVP